MESDNGKIYIATAIDNDELRRGATEASNILHGIGENATKEGASIDAAMKKIATTVSGIFAVSKIKDYVVQVANVRGEFQQLEMAFKTMLGSSQKADALMSQLINTAATTPFGMTDVAQGAKQLLAYGVEADKVNETLIRLGDIAAGLSIPLNDLAYLYGTTMVQGRLYTQDLNQFLGRGIPLTDELAKQFGVAKNEVKDLVEKGKVGFPEVEKAIVAMTSAGGKFGGLMEAQSQTITGQISNLEDGFEQMFNEIGKSTEGLISGTISVASTLVENWRTVGEAILAVIATYGVYKAAVISTAAVQNTLKTARHAEEAAQLYEVMNAEQQARISKLNLSKTSEEYYLAVKAETQAEMERQTQLAVTTQAELTAARERLASAESDKAAAAEKVAAKRAELEAVIQEAAAEQAAAAQKRIAIESEAQSRAALRVRKLQEQKDAAIAQARALKEANASQEVIAAKNREIATISKKIAAARAEEVQHARNIVAIRKEMVATVDATASKKVAQATTALETAEENLNTAAKARNTAARAVSSKAALLDSTVRRANTVETAANTAAQAAGTKASGVLSAATASLTNVFSKLGKSMKAHPWAWVLAAVAALAYGIYKLSSSLTGANECQKKLDEATKDYNKSVESEQAQIDAVFARLKTAQKGSEEYKNAKDAIIAQYGKYLEGLSSEVQSLNNVEAAYKAVSAAARDAARARAMEAFTKDAADTFAGTASDQKEKLYQLLKKKYGNQKYSNGSSKVDDIYWKLVRALENGGTINQKWLRQFDETHTYPGGTYTSNPIEDILKTYYKARKDYNDSMEEAGRRFGSNPLDKNDTAKTEVTKNKKYWEDYQKEQQAQLDAMTAAELKTKKAAQIRANIATAQKNIDAYSVSKTNAAASKAQRAAAKAQKEEDRTADQIAERTESINKYKESVIEANAEAELDIRQKQIENMEEGYMKQKAQIELNYDRLIQENKKREQDMIDELKDAMVLEFKNMNPKATKSQVLDYKASLTVTAADLTKEQQDQLAAYQKIAEDTRVKANKEMLRTMLQDALTYEQQRAKTAEEYQKKIENLYQHDENGNRLKDAGGNDMFIAGASQMNIDELQYQSEEAIKAVDEQFAQREDDYQAWCNAISSLSLEQLDAVLQDAKQKLEAAEGDKNATPQQLAAARAKVSKAQDELAKAKAQDKLNPGQKSIKEWEDLYRTLNEVEKEFEGIGNTIGGVIGDIISECGKAAVSTLQIIDGIKTFTNGAQKSIEATSKVASQSLKTVEKASVILTIISAALQIATQIANLFNNDDKKQEEIDRLQDRIDQLQWEIDNADTVRLKVDTDTTGLDLVHDALADARRELFLTGVELGDMSRVFSAAFSKASADMSLMQKAAKEIAGEVASASYTDGKWYGREGGSKYDESKEMLENYAQQMLLIDEQIEQEKSKKKSDDSAVKEMEQRLDEIYAKMTDLINSMVEDIVGGSAEEIADQLSDAFFEAFQNGEDAAKAWGDKVNDIVSDIVRRMLVQKFLTDRIGKVIDKYKDRWFDGEGNFMGIDEVLASVGDMKSDLTQVGEQWQQIYDALPDDIKEMVDSITGREGAAKGIAQASQDSVDELNGRMTAVQGHTFSISENTKLLLATTNEILRSVMNIEGETAGFGARLERMEASAAAMRDTLDDIATRGVRLKN